MPNTVNVQSDLVTHGYVGDGGYLDVGVAGFRVCRQPGLRARLADGGNRDHLVLLHGIRDGGIGGAIADADLLADLNREAAPAAERPAARAGERHVGRAGGDGDHRTLGEGLPQRRAVAGGRPEAGDLAGFHA